jgi:hypothetical protein
MIRIINLRKYKLKPDEVMIRVDRMTPIGNPYFMHDESERDLVCDKYDLWLQEMYKQPMIYAILDNIHQQSIKTDVALACWCAPKRCHAESIIKMISKW